MTEAHTSSIPEQMLAGGLERMRAVAMMRAAIAEDVGGMLDRLVDAGWSIDEDAVSLITGWWEAQGRTAAADGALLWQARRDGRAA